MESHEKMTSYFFIQSHMTKFDQKRFCTISFSYARLCVRYAINEAVIISSVSKAL